MSEPQHARLKQLFHAVADLPPAERISYLDEHCADEPELRRKVESLLAHDTIQDDVFDDGQLGIGQDLLAKAVGDAGMIPDRIGPYRVLDRLGEGGMGTVYLAEQDHPRRRVALKMIRPGVLSRGLLRRFKFEADVLGRLQHPGIAQIHEAGEVSTEAGRQPYFAMEYVEGVEMRGYARQHDLGTRARLELMARVCDAVQHAHQRGIVHRDLKPENVLVVEAPSAAAADAGADLAGIGQPKVLDFGVARATDSDIQLTTVRTDVGQLVGTITYMSPEQVCGDSAALDNRSDIYALGAMLYELLAGRPPFDLRHTSIPEAARMIREEEPTRLGSIRTVFRDEIDTIVTKALDKDRIRRYQTAAEMAADIRRYLADQPITAHPPSTFYQLRKFAKRNRGLVTGLAAAVIILIAGVITSATLAVRAVRGEKRAQVEEQQATLNEAAARWSAYRANVAAADAVADTDPFRALDQLEAAPEEHRGWEWRHLASRLNTEIASHACAGHRSHVAVVARRADGEMIAALGRDGAVELTNLLTGDTLAIFRDARDLAALCLSPGASHLAASIEGDNKLIIWDVLTQSRTVTLPVAGDLARRTRFSPDGSLIAFMAEDQVLTVAETDTGNIRMRLSELEDWRDETPYAFDAKGQRLAFVERRRKLRVVTTDGHWLAEVRLPTDGISLAFNPDGSFLAVGMRDRYVSVHDANTLQLVNTLQGHAGPVRGVAFSQDGAYLASASTDQTTRIWDMATGQLVRTIGEGFRSSLVFSGDDVLLAGMTAAGVSVWAWQRDARLVLHGHERYVYRVTFNPDPRLPDLLASSAWDETVRLWDIWGGGPVAVVRATYPWKALGFTPDGSRLIGYDGEDSAQVAVWEPVTATRLVSPRTEADSRLFEVILDRERDVWSRLHDAAGLEQVYGGRTTSSDGKLRAELVDTEIRVFKVNTNPNELVQCIETGAERYSSIRFSPDCALLAVCRKDVGVRVWDLGTGEELATLTGHIGEVYSFAFSPNGSRIASCGNDGNIIIWDTDRFEQVGLLRGHKNYVYTVTFSPDGTMLASASGDGTVRIWDSVPVSERWSQLQRLRALRPQAERLVDKLLEQYQDPVAVADHLRADDHLEDELCHAALRVLQDR